MQIIAFIAKAKNGIIQIPQEHLQDLKSIQNNLKVIILVEPKEAPIKKKRKPLTSLKVKTKGLVFDRDEANAR